VVFLYALVSHVIFGGAFLYHLAFLLAMIVAKPVILGGNDTVVYNINTWRSNCIFSSNTKQAGVSATTTLIGRV